MPEFRLEFVICINICIDTQLHTHALSIALIIFAEKNSKVNCKIICIDSATFKNSIQYRSKVSYQSRRAGLTEVEMSGIN